MSLRLYTVGECGSDGYPPEWHESIKYAVRESADWRCIRCGHPYRNGEHGNGEWSACDEQCSHDGPTRDLAGTVEAQWRILTVHHLDGNKANCRWWNLAALCQRCHLEIQGRVNMAQVWPWEHSEWFKPYAAGYYAWAYEQRDITREEAEEQLDELLALEMK